MRGYLLVGCTTLAIACGGGEKKKVKKPKPKTDETEEVAKPETEEDRAERRRAQARKIVPEGTSCLPLALKEEGAPRLELGASGADAIVCAVDTEEERLLGPVGCWKVDLSSGELAYTEPKPLPGRGFSVTLDKKCARGYCLPKDAEADGSVAHIAWDLDGKKVAVLVGEQVHLFDAESKDHEASFSIRGDKGATGDATAVHYVGSSIVVQAGSGPDAGVWTFKADGAPQGRVMALGGKEEKPVSTHKGSFSVLDKARIGVAERGWEIMTTYEVETGKRAKLVRAAKKPACKAAELEAFWKDGDKVSDKCKGSIEALSGHLMGATAVAGARNFLVLFRGDRLGELGVLDARSLKEAKALKMPWCPAEGGDTEEASESDDEDASEGKGGKNTRGAKTSADPEEGGE